MSETREGAQGIWPVHSSSLSGNGRFAVFHSASDHLVPDDSNRVRDVFVKDLYTEDIIRVSVSSDGIEGNSESSGGAISADGRFVAFSSLASNLVPGDTNGSDDVFVHDMMTKKTSRVSLHSDGSQAYNRTCESVDISGDGRLVLFATETQFDPDDNDSYMDVFLHDRLTGETALVSRPPNSNWCLNGSVSDDGKFVVYQNGLFIDREKVFLVDLSTMENIQVNKGLNGVPDNGGAIWPSISADGRYVTFAGTGSNLVENDTNLSRDIFVYDKVADEISRVSVDSQGREGNYVSWNSSISADGKMVAFSSQASNLVPDDTNEERDVFLHDRDTGMTRRISQTLEGQELDAISLGPTISADGRKILFSSPGNFVDQDTNGITDVYLYGPSVSFDITPKIASAGDSLAFGVWEGKPLKEVYLFLWEVNGNPFAQALLLGTYGPDGRWNYSTTVPDFGGGFNTTLAFLVFARDPKTGRFVIPNTVELLLK